MEKNLKNINNLIYFYSSISIQVNDSIYEKLRNSMTTDHWKEMWDEKYKYLKAFEYYLN